MALRDKINQRWRVDDRRGMPMIGWGGIGLVGIVVVLAIGYFWGPEQAIQVRQDLQQNSPMVQQQTTNTWEYEGEDEYEVFASTVLGSLNGLWKWEFQKSDTIYQEPTLVLFRWGTQSACGWAVSQVGPHYCPLDSTIYLDETFFKELTQRFGAEGWDLAQAYVIGHEVGHHVQKLLSITNQTRRWDNESSIKLELQADCLAGIWMGKINQEGILEQNDLYQALDAAQAVGDDNIQKKTSWTTQPESRTHGSSAQRKERLMKGYNTQSFEACNTFG